MRYRVGTVLAVSLAVAGLAMALGGVAATDSGQTWENTFEGDTRASPTKDAQFFGGSTGESGYVLVGSDQDAGWVVGTDTTGTRKWERHLTEKGASLRDAVGLRDGGYLVVGSGAGGRQYAARLTPGGKTVWARTYGLGHLSGVVDGGKGSVVAVGPIDRSVSANGTAANFLRLDSKTGDIRHRVRAPDFRFWDVATRPDAPGYALSVYRGTEARPGLLFVDERGNRADLSRYGDNRDSMRAISSSPDGYALAGVDFDENGTGHGWVVSTDLDGDQQSEASPPTVTLSVARTPGGAVLAGSTGSGKLHWLDGNRTVRTRELGLGPRGVEVVGDHRVLAVGQALDPHNVNDYDGLAMVVDTRRSVATLTATRLGNRSVRLDASESRIYGGRSTFLWDLDGDGDVERETDDPRVVHRYNHVGTVTVGLSVQADGRTQDTATATVQFPDTRPPTARLRVPGDGPVPLGEPIELSAEASSDDGILERYEWDLDGDGRTDRETTTPTVTHRFDDRGTGQVGVTVVDTAGHRNETRTAVTVRPNDRPAVRVDGPTEMRVGQTVRVRAVVNDSIGQTSVTWERDGVRYGSGKSLPVQALEPGTITVRAIARDEFGATGTTEHQIRVRERLQLPFDPVVRLAEDLASRIVWGLLPSSS